MRASAAGSHRAASRPARSTLAALLEWLSGEPGERGPILDAKALRQRWPGIHQLTRVPQGAGGLAAAVVAVFVIGLRRRPSRHAPRRSDLLTGVKRTRAEIVASWKTRSCRGRGRPRSLRAEVTGSPAKPVARNPRSATGVPAVAALPQPDVRTADGNTTAGRWTRRCAAIWLRRRVRQTGQGAMREIVMPGMAQLLHRPACDFATMRSIALARRSAAIAVTG